MSNILFDLEHTNMSDLLLMTLFRDTGNVDEILSEIRICFLKRQSAKQAF